MSIPQARLAGLVPPNPLDECECGDYRRDHDDGEGKCRLCENFNYGGVEKCQRFRLAPAEAANAG